MLCPNCGTENLEEASSCQQCRLSFAQRICVACGANNLFTIIKCQMCGNDLVHRVCPACGVVYPVHERVCTVDDSKLAPGTDRVAALSWVAEEQARAAEFQQRVDTRVGALREAEKANAEREK